MKNLRMLVYLFILLLSSALFPSPAGMPWARARTEALNVQSGSGGRMLWNRTYGGPQFEEASSIQETSDGGYIIAGTTNSFGAGEFDFYLVRVDSGGKMLWNRTYGGPLIDVASSVQVTRDGGYIIAGYTNSFSKSWDFYIVRTDFEGKMLWNRTYGGPQFEKASSIQETSDGGYIIVGTISSLDPFSEDVYLVKTDPEGNILWNRTYGRFENEQGYPILDYGNSVQETSDGGYIIAGHTTAFGMDSDVCLIKTDPEGNMLWNGTYGGPSSGRGYSACETSDGGYVIAGFTKPFMMIGDQEVFLVKTDSGGDMLWNRTYGGPGRDSCSSVQETGDGGYIIAGNKISIDDENSDFYLVKTDSGGNMLWNRTYGGPGMDSCSSVQETGDGGYIIAGTTMSPEMDAAIYLIRIAPFPVPSSITCQVSANTTMQGDALNVSGKVTPSTLHRDITLIYALPDGTTVTRTVKTNTDSVFLDEYAPDTPGSWEVTASMEGDAYYEASTSEPVAFTVERPAQGAPLYVYGSLVAVAAIAVLTAWLLLRRR